MALRKKGEFFYGDAQSDIRDVLLDYSEANHYPATHFADATCACGGKLFKLNLDDEAGAAIRVCASCGDEHPIGDSEDYIDDTDLYECRCFCGSVIFEITVGVALYEDSEDVNWIYVGCRCPKCKLAGCYGDWKNEYPGYQELLSRI
jgi:hypothetical protein